MFLLEIVSQLLRPHCFCSRSTKINLYIYCVIIIFIGKITEDISKTAKGAAESIADTGSKLGQTSAFRTISQVRVLIQLWHSKLSMLCV